MKNKTTKPKKRNSFTPLQINQSIQKKNSTVWESKGASVPFVGTFATLLSQTVHSPRSKKYSKRKFVTGFTLTELLMVVVIIAILATMMYPQFESFRIRAKMSELYNTVTIIEAAENLYYFKYGNYVGWQCTEDQDLSYTTSQTQIDNFRTILNIYVPGMDSTFVYGVYYDPARIYIRVRAHYGWGILCYKWIEGANKGKWSVVTTHQWYKYLSEKETTPRL